MILLTFFASCGSPTNNSVDRLQSLYRQRIQNSSRIIYAFSYSADYAFTSEYTGMTILDSSITFEKSKIEKLPAEYFAAKPTGTYLRMFAINYGESPRSEKDTLLTPIRQYAKKINDIRVDIVEYNDTYGTATTSTGLMEYTFDRLMETEDSLIFHNVIKISGGREFSATTSFPKGNIKIIDTTNNDIDFIEIEQIIVQRGDISKPTKPLELVPNQPVVGFATYRFYPTRETKLTSLTDYGIFKRLK
jgi:hypothetical protein